MKSTKVAQPNRRLRSVHLVAIVALPVFFLLVWLSGLQRASLEQAQAASTLSVDDTTTLSLRSENISLATLPGWDSLKVIDPVVISDSGRYKMWYTGQSQDGKFRIGYATSSDRVNWTRYSNNPVLDVGATGNWDSEMVRVNTVIKDSNTYRMWYAGGLPQQRIGYATSTDGINWNKYAGNPVLDVDPAPSWDAGVVSFASVISDGGNYKIWYTGYDSLGFFGGVSRIGYATSPDGINWTKHPGNPVLDKGLVSSWEETGIFDSHVISDGVSYKMWYSGLEGQFLSGSEVIRIGLATSTNGTAWTKSTNNPILDVNPAGWDKQTATGVWVISDGSMYHMWYHGGAVGDAEMIGYATSTDGISWIKYAGNPVLGLTSFVYLPVVVKN